MGSKKKLLKRVEDINHPGSRKTLATIRDIKKIKKRDEIKKNHALKVNNMCFCLLFQFLRNPPFIPGQRKRSSTCILY